MLRVIFKWIDPDGRTVNSPREMHTIPRKGELVSINGNGYREVHDVNWLIAGPDLDYDADVILYLYPDSRQE